MLNNFNNHIFKTEVLRVIHVGLLCTQEVPSLRPSMSMALRMLAKTDEPLPPPSNPPFVDETTMELNDLPENPRYHNGDNSASIASVSQSDFFPR